MTLPSNRQLKQLECVSSHGRLAFHPEGRQLAVSCATGIKVYDLETARKCSRIYGSPQKRTASPGTRTARRWQPPATTRGFISGTSPLSKRTHVLEGSRSVGIGIAFNRIRRSARQQRLGGRPAAVGPPDGHATVQPCHRGVTVSLILDDRLLAYDLRDNKLGSWEVAAGASTERWPRCSRRPGVIMIIRLSVRTDACWPWERMTASACGTCRAARNSRSSSRRGLVLPCLSRRARC